MKKIFKLILLVSFLGLGSTSRAQVVMAEFLSVNHEGVVANSKCNNGKPLYYKFQYDSTNNVRIYYTLYLYQDAAKTQAILQLPVLMRNLIYTYYLDINVIAKGAVSKVVALILKKDLRWSRLKFSATEECSRIYPPVYDRVNNVDNFDALLQNTIMQLDKNVDFNCYAGTVGK